MPEHVLVVGAGYVGMPAAGLIAATGTRVTAVRRSSDVEVPAGVDLVAADVLTDDGLSRLPRDADAVVIALSPGGRDPERYRAVYLDAVSRVVAHQEVPPSLVAVTTSTAVYGQADGSVVHEDSPTEPSRDTAKVLVEAEAHLAGMARESGIATVSLRLAGIYGPGRTRLIEQVRDGEATCDEVTVSNRIHRDDAASAIAHLVAMPPSEVPAVLNVVDDAPTPLCEVLRWLAGQVDAAPPTVVDPGEGSSRSGAKIVTNQRLRGLGWVPTFPTYREGFTSLL